MLFYFWFMGLYEQFIRFLLFCKLGSIKMLSIGLSSKAIKLYKQIGYREGISSLTYNMIHPPLESWSNL